MIWQILGPLSLLAAFGLASTLPLSLFPLDLFIVGAIGLYFAARWQTKGSSYALIVLAIVGIGVHAFVENHHFLRLGLEAALACSFFITALTFESVSDQISSLQTQFDSRGSAIQNLEEEIAKARESTLQTEIAHAQRLEELQKNLDDLSVEKSSFEILNDVLRKTNAAYTEEKKALEAQIVDQQRGLAAVLTERLEAQNEIEQLKSTDWAAHSRALLEELNRARFNEEQMRQMNETVVRMHAIAKHEAKQAEGALQAVLKEKEEVSLEADALRNALGQAEAKCLQLEQEGVEQAAETIAELKKERLDLQERLAATEQKVHELAQIDFLYQQLKSQFEEKGRVLHEARSALFKMETELQTIQKEKEEHEPFLPHSLSAEIERLDEEISELRAENNQLQELVTHLTNVPAVPFAAHRIPLPAGQPSLEETLREALTPKRKKKAKKPLQQDLLF